MRSTLSAHCYLVVLTQNTFQPYLDLLYHYMSRFLKDALCTASCPSVTSAHQLKNERQRQFNMHTPPTATAREENSCDRTCAMTDKWITCSLQRYKPSRRSAADCLYPPTRPSILVSHAPGVTSRFWLALRRPSPLFRPALVACRPSVHVSYARGVTSSDYYI